METSIPVICTLLLVEVLFSGPILAQEDVSPEQEVMSDMRKVCDWQIANNYDASNNWLYGALLPGITATYETAKNAVYLDRSISWAEKFNWELRSSSNVYHADDHCCGQTYLDLYMIDSPQAARYADTQNRFDTIIADPQTYNCSVFSQVVWDWCDALFMAPPAWSRLSHVTGAPQYLNAMHSMWMDTQNCLYNDDNDHDTEPPEYLWWRDKNKIPLRYDGKKEFWSRGNGWVAGGLARVLQFTPENDPNRSNYVTVFQQMCEKLATLQGLDGFWRSDLLSPDRYPNPESSGTAFFCYAMAWGVNEGILDAAMYGPVVENAWDGMVNLAVHPDGKLGYVQQVGEAPGVADYDDTQVYAVGAFLMAGSEMYKYYQAQNSAAVDNLEAYSDNNPLKAKLPDIWKDKTDNGTTASISLEGIANQSLQLDYDNQQAPYFAETYRDFSPVKDFTANDSEILTLYLKGQNTNASDEFYCTLVDSSDNTATQRITDPNTLVLPDWKKIYFAVNQFEQIDLSQIKRLIIGIGADSPSGPQSGTGTIWVDEFYLSQMICNDNQLAGDFDNNCKVNLSDFSQIASQWMEQYYVLPIPVDPGSQNLTAKWSFDESTDTMAADSTGNGHDGTLVDASWAPGSGTDGGGVSIDRASSTSSRVEIPTAAIPLSQGTYSAWVNLYEDQTSSVRYIFGHTTIPAWANRIQFYMDSSDTSLDLGLGASHRSSTAIMTLQTLVWHHIALTWDGSNYQVYVDGVLKASGAYSGLSELQSVTHIGNNGSDSPTEAFNGLIDEVSIYETVLTPEEILYLADAVPMVVNPRRTDLYTDGIIDLKDLSLFIADWLDCALSPVEASFD